MSIVTRKPKEEKLKVNKSFRVEGNQLKKLDGTVKESMIFFYKSVLKRWCVRYTILKNQFSSYHYLFQKVSIKKSFFVLCLLTRAKQREQEKMKFTCNFQQLPTVQKLPCEIVELNQVLRRLQKLKVK